MEEFLQRMLEAWPDGALGAPDAERIRLTGPEDARAVLHDGRGLPPPFHRGLRIGTSYHGAEMAVAGLVLVTTRTAQVCERLRTFGDRLHVLAERSGMKVLRCTPFSVAAVPGGGFHLDVVARLQLVGHSGLTEEASHQVGDSWTGATGWRRVTVEANAQQARRRDAGMALSTDPVMAACLARMPDGQRRRLLKLLLAKPQAPRDAVGWSAGANWNHAALAMEGMAMDPAIETIRVKDGMVVGRVRLSETVTWNAGSLIAKGGVFPDSVLEGSAGRAIGDVVAHPLLREGVLVERAWMDRTGAVRIKALYDAIRIS